MADKKTSTLPQEKKGEKTSAAPKQSTPSSRRSVKNLLSTLPKSKKNSSSLARSKSNVSVTETVSIADAISDTRSVASIPGSTAPSVGSPSASPLVPIKNEKVFIVPKSPRPTLSSVTKKSKDGLKKTIMKSGKLRMPRFGNKNESAPIKVEPVVDLHRTNRTDDELLTQDPPEVATEADGSLKTSSPVAAVKGHVFEDDWPIQDTFKRVGEIIKQGPRESIYLEPEKDQTSDVVAEPLNGDAVANGEQDIVSQASNSLSPQSPPSPSPLNESIPSPPSTPTTPTGDVEPLNFNKKSPLTLKKEIMKITNRKVSEGNRYIADKIERKISLNQPKLSSNQHDLLFKILVIGDLGTGKTSIIKRYVHQFFSQHYRATIGVDFALKVLSWDENITIRLQLWDIAGQERFGNMTRVYYKEAVGAFIVFDVTRASTYEAVLKWKQDLDSKVQLPDGQEIPCVLLANKCDQPKEGAVNSHSKMDEFCKQNKFLSWFETSAKDNINIDEAAHSLVSAILVNEMKKIDERDQLNGSNSRDIIDIAPDSSRRSEIRKFCNFC